MSWEENLHVVPSRNEPLLRSAIGQTIQSIARYADGGPEEVLASEAYRTRQTQPFQLFSLADGQIVLRMRNGDSLAFGGSEEMASVTVERANETELRQDDWCAIEADDTRYSEPVFARAIGHQIVGLRILKFEMKSTQTRVMSPALERRPREAGVVIELDDGSGLFISQSMLPAPANLGIFPADALAKTELSYRELLHLRAEPAKIPVVRVGFFRELSHGKKDGPELKQALRAAGDPEEAKVVRYLRAGKVFMASPGIVRDVVDSESPMIGSLSILTDGRYAWPSDLAHYVERYHVRLPEDFLAHMAAQHWRVPQSIELESLQLV